MAQSTSDQRNLVQKLPHSAAYSRGRAEIFFLSLHLLGQNENVAHCSLYSPFSCSGRGALPLLTTGRCLLGEEVLLLWLG